MQELDVVITDFLLATECFLFSYLLLRYHNEHKKFCLWFFITFISIAITSLIGGVTHAYAHYPQTELMANAWKVTLILLGVSSFCVWNVGGFILFKSQGYHKYMFVFSALSFAAYSFYICFVSSGFLAAMVYYIPSATFLLLCFVVQFHRVWHKHIAYGVFGILLLFITSGMQQIEMEVGNLSHNAVFHIAQLLSLYLIYKAASNLSGEESKLRHQTT